MSHLTFADVAAGAAVVVGVLAVALALLAHRRLTRLARRGAAAVPTTADGLAAFCAEVRGDIAALAARLDAVEAAQRDALSRVAVVRYDAFEDIGGQLSFSAAVLDGGGDGLVLTGITGRSEARSYAKEVRAGGVTRAFSPEESEAVDVAMGRQQPARSPAGVR